MSRAKSWSIRTSLKKPLLPICQLHCHLNSIILCDVSSDLAVSVEKHIHVPPTILRQASKGTAGTELWDSSPLVLCCQPE